MTLEKLQPEPSENYPVTKRLLQIYASWPVSSASAERVFLPSILKRLIKEQQWDNKID